MKAVSSSTRRVGSGIREMAEEAARRQRMSLGDWLNAVVADEAAATGVLVRDISMEDRQSAIITRLRDMAPSTAAPAAAKPEPAAAPAAATKSTDAPPRPAPKAERQRDRRREQTDIEESRGRQESSGGRRRGGRPEGGRSRHEPETGDRSGRRRDDAVAQRARTIDFEVSVEDMLAGIERRVARTQRQTDAALASMTELLDTTADQRSAFAAMAERLGEVEEQVVAQGGADIRPIKGSLARLEARLDTLTRREDPVRSADVVEELAAGNRVARSLLGPARVDTEADAMAPATPAVIERLEAKLNSILDAVKTAPAETQPAAEPMGSRKLRDAIDAIALRQKTLESDPTAPVALRLVRPMRHIDGNVPRDASAGLVHLGRDVQTLLAKVDDVRRDVAEQAAVHKQAEQQTRSLEDLRADVANLASALGDLAPRRSVAAIETAITDLNDRVAHLRENGDIEAKLDPLSQSLQDMRRALADNDPRPVIGALEREVRTVGSRLQGLGAVDPAAMSRLQTQTADIHDLLSTTAQPVTLVKIERDLAALMRRMDEAQAPRPPAAEDLRTLVESTIQTPVLQTIERRLDALAAKLDEAVGKAATADQAARRNDAVAATDIAARSGRDGVLRADGETLERMIGTLTSAIETVRRPDAATDALGTLEHQISRLAERLDRSEVEFASLSTLQSSVSALFGQLEESRKVSLDIAEQAARKAVRDLPEAGAAAHVTREIADMRLLQDAADKRTSATLSAVHDTLETMVERLAQMERGAPVTPRAATPSRQDEPRRATPTVATESVRDVAAFGRGEDFLIEPGRGFLPGRDDAAPDAGGRADFIAAARRAARAAQRDAEAVGAPRPHAPAPDAQTPHAALVQAKAFFASRKRAIVLSLAALFVVAGCYAVVRTAHRDAPSPVPKAVSALPSPKGQMRDDAPATTASIPAAPARPIGGSEPVVAGGMSMPPSTAARLGGMGVEMPRALPGTRLRDMAEAGIAGAQFETGNRYAEGRVLPRDPKSAAQWYEKAATQGFAPAQYRLGSLFEKGAGVPRDLTTAKMWYGKAAAAGNARAMHNLAVLAAEGAGDKPDYQNAATLFRKAAQFGIRDSQYNLAILMARGLGVEQNLVQSYMWFAVAAAQGDVDAGKKRDDVGGRMSAADLAAAKTAVDLFRPQPLDSAANDAQPPAGGWDGAAPITADKAVRPKVSAL